MRSYALILALLVALPAFAGEAGAQEFQVVANPSVALDQVTAGDLSKVFQKKSGDLAGVKVVPVDLGGDSPTREAFSQAVHGRSASAIESYWQQQIFSGKDVPPDQMGSDAEVLSFVASTPGAVGYVSASADVSSVQVIQVAR